MGISARLVTEDGRSLETVEDPTNALHSMLPKPGDGNYGCLSAIDWYGDTVFNHLQAPTFLAEWKKIAPRVRDEHGARVYQAILRMAERLTNERHVYLKFVGD